MKLSKKKCLRFANFHQNKMNMDNTITLNVQISSTTLGMEDHGFMTFWLNMIWEGSGQGFGGYCIGEASDKNKNVMHTGFKCGIECIRKILETVGVSSWEKLPGKYVRIQTRGHNGKIFAIGHIINDKWFNIEQHFSSQ